MSNRNTQIEQLYNLAERLGGDDGAIVNGAIGLIECSIKERAEANQFVTIVVLNDGETFTDISGCSVCIIPLEDYERVIAEGGDARDFRPIVEIALNDQTFPQDDEAWDHGGALGQFQREENA